MAIHLFFEDIPEFKLNKRQLFQWLKEVAKNEEKTLGEINIILCPDEYLLSLNQKYLNHQTFTDIITFPYTDTSNTKLSGDIFISIDRIRENAATQDTTELNELLRVIVHGLLHLIGYNDKSKDQKLLMRKKEDQCLLLYQEMFHVEH